MTPSSPPAPLLVLLPGLDGTGKLFADFIEALGTEVEARVVTYPLNERLGYEELEQRVRSMLPTNRPFALLGESFSGPIAIRIAADPPPGLKAAILCVTFAKNPYPWLAWMRPFVGAMPVRTMPRWVRSLVMWGSRTSERIPEAAERATASVDAPVLRHRIGAMLDVDASAALARIALPLLVVQASADNVVPAAATPIVSAAQPRARLVRLEGPHLLLQSRPRECAAVMAPFVRESIMSTSHS